jgi:hypothetical protein
MAGHISRRTAERFQDKGFERPRGSYDMDSVVLTCDKRHRTSCKTVMDRTLFGMNTGLEITLTNAIMPVRWP